MFSETAQVTYKSQTYQTQISIAEGKASFDLFGKKFSSVGFSCFEVDGEDVEESIEVLFSVPLHLTKRSESLVLEVKIISLDSDIKIELRTFLDNSTFVSINDDMEFALIGLQNELGKNARIQCCLSCRFSSFNPYGNMGFGDLWCFLEHEQQVGSIRGKDDLVDFIQDKIFPKTEEFFRCEHFREIVKGDFVYSGWEPLANQE